MPRKSREKCPEAIYHIMCRSESEFLLFRNDNDKEYYLGLIKRFIDKYKCCIYAYCLMDNHLHLQFDPKGFDLSKFMHCLNTAYVRYYNKKYKRHGHVFQGRFESRVVDSNRYNMTLSAYIHNNSKDLEGYKDREELYKYSSYGIYLGLRRDTLEIIDISFIMQLFNITDVNNFREKYFEFVSNHRDIDSYKQLKEKFSSAIENEYISGRKTIIRSMTPSKVISYISGKIMIPGNLSVAANGSKLLREFRSICAYVLRVLCGLGYREICQNIYNITISGCSRLIDRGYKLLEDEKLIYTSLFEDIIINCI